ncbi:hypothetical protein KY335_04700 [Candidatus Woesearchaeota archaeon]|nr:hypothetical protein [Candidatus Woesearchaeota archaeon]MBW3014507.1 hypothetical protein [Candidatus Woesearchaeota archaeon]
MSNKKRGQVEVRVVIYLLAVFIAALILSYGYIAIKGLIFTQEDILLITFKEDIKDKVEEKSYEFRSVEKLTFSLPSSYDEICFGDIRDVTAALNSLDEDYVLVRNSVRDSVKRNFFILQRGRLIDAFYVGDLVIDGTFNCLEVSNGVINLEFRAMGKSGVKISEWV